jgi:16S rRNA (cytosine967-C5)-methyltransferase
MTTSGAAGAPPAQRPGGRSRAPQQPGRAVRTARALAIQALVEVDGGARANVIVPELLGTSGLAERDRAFVTELVYGTVRMKRACDWLFNRHVRRRPDPDVLAALRLGAYQMVFLGTPAHAAVSATVDALGGPGRGFANAVLRRVAEQSASGPPSWPDDATRLSYPDWMVERLIADVGREDALAALAVMNEAASATVRPDGYIQDLASQWVAAVAAGVAGPGDRIIDLCAAPGGKATWMAYGPGGPSGSPAAPSPTGTGRPALVIAADIDLGRAQVMAGNASRLGLGNVATVVADACRPPLPGGSFDRVLVDAPCSGLGVLRRRPDARWRIQPDDLPRLAALQRRMVDAALPLVRPGGVLVYSVCTLTLAETAGIDRWLAEAHPEARPVMPPGLLGPPWERTGRGARLLPQAAGTDGMFVLALEVTDGRRRR